MRLAAGNHVRPAANRGLILAPLVTLGIVRPAVGFDLGLVLPFGLAPAVPAAAATPALPLPLRGAHDVILSSRSNRARSDCCALSSAFLALA